MGICRPGMSPFLLFSRACPAAFPSYRESLPKTSKAEEGRGEGMFILAFLRRSFPLSPTGRSGFSPQVIPSYKETLPETSKAEEERGEGMFVPAFLRRSFQPSSAGRSRLLPQVVPAFPCRLFPCLPLQVIPRWEPGHPACRQWGAASCFGMCGQNGLSPPR